MDNWPDLLPLDCVPDLLDADLILLLKLSQPVEWDAVQREGESFEDWIPANNDPAQPFHFKYVWSFNQWLNSPSLKSFKLNTLTVVLDRDFS